MAESIAETVRRTLIAAAKSLNVRDIFNLNDTIENTTQIAAALRDEMQAGRVEREGLAGHYTYVITDKGRSFLPVNARREAAARDLKSVMGAKPKPKSAPKRTLADVVNRAASTSAPGPQPVATPAQPATVARPALAAPADTTSTAGRTQARAVELPPVSDDAPTRLAALTIAHWPGTLSSMPAELRVAIAQQIAPLQVP